MLQQSRTNKRARDAVYQMIYEDLRKLAAYRVRPGETLSVTSLVNESYLKLTERTGQQWHDRGHFLRVAAKSMRQITIDYVRAKMTEKRGAGWVGVPLDSLELAASQKPAMVLALEEGLNNLAQTEPRLVDVVECRFFTGLTIEETAAALGISHSTVERDWHRARAWLQTI